MAYLYTANLGSQGGYTYLYVDPTYKNGYIDILNDFNWNAAGGYVDEVPYLIVKEMELNFGQVIQNILGYVTAASNTFGGQSIGQTIAGNVGTVVNNAGFPQGNYDKNDPYAITYAAHDTGFTYVFPHLIRNGTTRKGTTYNEWARTNLGNVAGNLGEGLLGFTPGLEAATKAGSKFLRSELGGSGLGLEDIVSYSKTAAKQIKISFPLYNTGSEQSSIMNFDFVNLFGLQNLKMRTSFYTFIPPKIYTIESPGQGGIYMPAAYVKSFDVKSIGTTRFMNSGQYSNYGNYDYIDKNNTNVGTGTAPTNGVLIPEAYKVEITFEEMIPQSSNIMFGSLGGQKISVVNNTTGKVKAPVGPNAGNPSVQLGPNTYFPTQ